ncbi:MAG: GTP 3',8-cyclase MoaA [Planctomycetota bacterium]
MEPTPAPTFDRLGRPLRSLRLSVTDRCNLRCTYCMPEENYVWLPRADLLDFDELARVARVFAHLGVDKLRLTGGEPLLRRDLVDLVARLRVVPGIRELTLTTNGILLGPLATVLRSAGLDRVTVSLDTLRPERFEQLAGRAALPAVLHGIAAARAAGFQDLKLNTVLMRGCNDDEVEALLDFAAASSAELRFIEYMDVGGATRWEQGRVLPRAELLAVLGRRFGAITALVEDGSSAPADRFALPDGRVFGVISSTTEPFCGACDRARITADGTLFTCLYARHGVQLRDALRQGADDGELAALVARVWGARADRGAQERLALQQSRRALAAADELRDDPHLEMHTRGG